LHSMPQTFVNAPGAGFAIQPLLIIVNQTGTPTYLTSDNSIFFYLGTQAVAQLECLINPGTSRYLYSISPDVNTFSGDTSLYENFALIGSTTVDPTGTGGNVTIVVYYMIVPLT